MTITPDEAGAMLAEVEGVVARVKQSRIYRDSSAAMIFWGFLIASGNVASPFAGRWTGYLWVALDALGVAVTVAMLNRSRPRTPIDGRMIAAFALFFGFGLVWSEALGRMGPRELNAFWPTLFLFMYALAGLWFGRAFTLLGVGLAALILAGYLWAGPRYELYLAIVNGGGLIVCGLAMRRA